MKNTKGKMEAYAKTTHTCYFAFFTAYLTSYFISIHQWLG